MNDIKKSTSNESRLPIIDLHCDLLAYLASVKHARPDKTQDIGCAIPYLQEGNVKLLTLAVYLGTASANPDLVAKQIRWFNDLADKYHDSFELISKGDYRSNVITSSKTSIIASIENASVLCGDDEPLNMAFERLEGICHKVSALFYISLTHHGENRFGGGNNTTAGLKDDGKTLLDYLDGKMIPIDLSHTSDALAHDIINHIDKHALKINIIASHSNFRSVFNHPRNLPDELVREIIGRKGLIGMNFLRAYLHSDNPNTLIKHIEYGFANGASDALCFGSDYFPTKEHPDKSRIPFFFEEHENAGKYQDIMQSLNDILNPEQLEAIAYKNVVSFLDRLWSS
jgi:microsomal dipeptidase-like Zn-dependent dipeptidase